MQFKAAVTDKGVACCSKDDPDDESLRLGQNQSAAAHKELLCRAQLTAEPMPARRPLAPGWQYSRYQQTWPDKKVRRPHQAFPLSSQRCRVSILRKQVWSTESQLNPHAHPLGPAQLTSEKWKRRQKTSAERAHSKVTFIQRAPNWAERTLNWVETETTPNPQKPKLIKKPRQTKQHRFLTLHLLKQW